MKKKLAFLFVLVLTVFCLCFSPLSIAGGRDRGVSKGKSLFRMRCRVCHNPGGKAHNLDPRKKKIKEWDGVFAKDKYKQYPCKKQWEKLSDKDLVNILKFLHSEAPDSKVPRGCG